ncbi:muscarinic acetylcholine receptor M2 isoform X2 [Aplysia californica]|uniref:Muscarinic acetylcholine receptor M2 isoform X1 n=1 Tax=Aplysia californica TaxID=6500 RepID=A0ABM0JNR4_APLCA|nr:muscarinic acetylcholine receptor M2 isoform X1 [Aplysia californica]XP_005097993.1 muscarinic acetylcholine receptor M2 isoform X1 [Aplysia californica]XP_012937766.1 muscarinic acetylcholine receptor M2 isoform X2 [Aplysia californica]
MAFETSTDGLIVDDDALNNVTDTERMAYLAELQEYTTRIMLPTIVLLVCFAVVGFFGNILVLIVYYRKVRGKSALVFIMAIAGFDLFTNMTAIPAEIYAMFHFWHFDAAHLCRARYFSTSVTIVSSACLLLVFSVDRYRKICRPFGRQLTVRQAKVLCVSITVFSSVASVPVLVLFGTMTRPTHRPDIVGNQCSIDDSFINTIWPTVYMGFLLFLFLSCFIPLVVLNVLVLIAACGRGRVRVFSISSPAHLHDNSENNSQSSTTSPETCDNASKARNESPSTSKEGSAFRSRLMGRVASQTGEMGMVFSRENDGSDKIGEGKLCGATEDTSDRKPKATDFCCSEHRKTKQVSVPSAKMVSFIQTSAQEDCIRPDPNSTNAEKDKGQITAVIPGTSKEQNIKKKNPAGEKTDMSVTNPNRKLKPRILQILTSEAKKKSPASTLGQPAQRHSIGKTTTKLIIVSAVYIISFIPFFSVMLFYLTSVAKFKTMDDVSLTLCNLFLRFYYLNSAANPVIYSLCDAVFWRDCLQLLKCKGKVRNTQN